MLEALVGSILTMIIEVISLYKWIVIISTLLTWVKPDPNNSLIQIMNKLTEPVYAWIRSKVNTTINGIDMAPLMLIVFLIFVQTLLLKMIVL